MPISSKNIFPEKHIVFVTGTDTEVGKTFVSCLIINALNSKGIRAIPYKPVETGVRTLKESDSFKLASATGGLVRPDDICLYRFREPVTPLLIEKLKGTRFSLKRIITHANKLKQKGDLLLIEGAGGILSPLSRFGWIDLILKMNAEVILIIGNKLGCLNHALLTEHFLLTHKIPCIGWILNNPSPHQDFASTYNRHLLQKLMITPFIEEVPHGNFISNKLKNKIAKKLLGYLKRSNLLKHRLSSGMKIKNEKKSYPSH